MSASSAASAGSIGPAFGRWLFSSIGKKTVVAVTGVILILFVTGHLLGNLTIYFGPHAVNSYALHLRDLGPLLWLVRIGLLTSVGLHIFFTMLLWKENAAARPQKYAVPATIQTTLYARTMRLTGLFVLAFVVFHLAQFTFLLVDKSYATLETSVDGRTAHDVYAMLVLGFRHQWVDAVYIVALFFLALHLSHGVSSLFQTLGWNTQTMRPFYERVSRVYVWILFFGYISIPVAVQCGLGANIVK